MNNSSYIIGFANKFFTLWSVSKFTRNDETGCSKVASYTYIKNISFDEDKVKELFPGVEIDMSLRGHSSFEVVERIDDDSKFQFGRYKGDLISECSDYSYMMWYFNNGCSDGNKEAIKEVLFAEGYELDNHGYIITPEEVAERKVAEEKLNNRLTEFNGSPVTIMMDSNLDENGYYMIENFIVVKFADYVVREYNGYPYGMPAIKGKGKRVKNKNIILKNYTVSKEGMNNVITVTEFEVVK